MLQALTSEHGQRWRAIRRCSRKLVIFPGLPNPWILAPMAGVSEMHYRLLVKKMGASAAPTELISLGVEGLRWAEFFGRDAGLRWAEYLYTTPLRSFLAQRSHQGASLIAVPGVSAPLHSAPEPQSGIGSPPVLPPPIVAAVR